jgi:hypothetical protein
MIRPPPSLCHRAHGVQAVEHIPELVIDLGDVIPGQHFTDTTQGFGDPAVIVVHGVVHEVAAGTQTGASVDAAGQQAGVIEHKVGPSTKG